jgi:hypothetical protein
LASVLDTGRDPTEEPYKLSRHSERNRIEPNNASDRTVTPARLTSGQGGRSAENIKP